MSTTGIITFKDEYGDAFLVRRGHDGTPDIVMRDLEAALTTSKGRWDGSEIGQLLSLFIGLVYDPDERIQDYELLTGMPTDHNYRYEVVYEDHEWRARVVS